MPSHQQSRVFFSSSDGAVSCNLLRSAAQRIATQATCYIRQNVGKVGGGLLRV
jgi:hypothetical protein